MLLKRARTLLEGLSQYDKSWLIFIVKTEYHFFLEKKEVKRFKELLRNVPFPKSEIPKARS